MATDRGKVTGRKRAARVEAEQPMAPSLEPEGLAALEEYFSHCQVYLEYGCGGSTYAAAQAGIRHILSVDTSLDWIGKVMDATKNLSSHVTIRHCDVGPVADWGHPVDAKQIYRFHQFAILPWDAARAAGVSPNLILVDGRFRVASFLYSLMAADAGTIILFDDYMNRPQYHEVEKYCKRVGQRGRMGIFVVTERRPLIELAEKFAEYSIIPA